MDILEEQKPVLLVKIGCIIIQVFSALKHASFLTFFFLDTCPFKAICVIIILIPEPE